MQASHPTRKRVVRGSAVLRLLAWAWLLTTCVVPGGALAQTNDDPVLIGTREYRRVEFKVNAGGFVSDQRPILARLESGNFVVTWHEGTPPDCYARVFDPTGTPVGSIFLVHPGFTSDEQYGPSAAALPADGVMFAWGGDAYVDGRRFDRDRQPVGQRFTVADVAAWPAVASHSSGEFLVALGSSDTTVQARRYDATGTATALADIGAFVSGQFHPSVAYATDGRFVVAWPAAGQILARTFTGEFSQLDPQFVATSPDAGQAFYPSVGYNSRAELMVAWSGSGKEDSQGVYVRRFREDGTPYGPEVLVNVTVAGGQAIPNLAVGTNDESLISWVSSGDVYGRLFDAEGLPVGLEFRVNRFTNGSQSIAHFGGLHGNGILNNSNLVVAWAGDGTNGAGVYVTLLQYQRLTSDPEIIGQPQSRSVDVGSRAEFCVATVGTPPLRYQWRKNGANLPGETNNCLVLSNALPSDGGTYSVVVISASGGAAISVPAQLRLNVPFRPPGDRFAERVPLTNSLVAGTNLFATKEDGEPDHGGKRGGSSVWYTWRQPTNGIAVFRTSGSEFDTLLGVYRGTQVDLLEPVAGDEDKGGFLTSLVQFNVLANTDYHIAIDGFAGGQGAFLLEWVFEPTADRVPGFSVGGHPRSQTVLPGGTANFAFDSPDTPLSSLWYRNGQPIPGATGGTLSIPGVTSQQVGEYLVRITNLAGRVAESLGATLEIGPFPDGRSVEKFEDLFVGRAGGGGEGRLVAASAASPIISVAAGILSKQELSNTNSTQGGTSLDCRLVTSSTRWIGLQPETNGTLQLNTIGSQIGTVLALYVGSHATNRVLVACDASPSLEGIRGRLDWEVTAGTVYSAKLDGVDGAKGLMNLNWLLVPNRAPRFSPMPTNRFWINVGQTLVITNGASDPQGLRFQLQAGPRSGRLDPTNGMFTWTPSCLEGSSSNVVTVQVTDQDPGWPLSATRTFYVMVDECVEMSAGFSVVAVGSTTSLWMTLESSVELTNLSLHMPRDRRLENWAVLTSLAGVSARLWNTNADYLVLSVDSSRGGRRIGPGPIPLALLGFRAIADQPSSFLPVIVNSVEGRKPDGIKVANAAGFPGRVVVVGVQPLLQARYVPGVGAALTIYGQPGARVILQAATALEWATALGEWSGFLQATQFTLLSEDLSNTIALPLTHWPGFYRVVRTD